MLDKFFYLNSFGEILNFGQDGLYAFYNDLRDYEWDQINNNGIITFEMNAKNKLLPVLFLSSNGEKTRKLRNRAYSIIDKDIMSKKKGKLYINEYFLECNICGITNAKYLNNERYLKANMKICSEKPLWKKNTVFNFRKQISQSIENNKDYPYDYPKDLLLNETGKKSIKNENDFASKFILKIYGPVNNPVIFISGHEYSFSCKLEESETLIIDSDKGTIIKKYGTSSINMFNSRNKEISVFEDIQTGYNEIEWNNEFDFDLVLIDLRAEPIWSWTESKMYDVQDIENKNGNYFLIDSNGKYMKDSNNETIAVTEGSF